MGGGGEVVRPHFLYPMAVPSQTRDFRNGIFIKKVRILWHKPDGGGKPNLLMRSIKFLRPWDGVWAEDASYSTIVVPEHDLSVCFKFLKIPNQTTNK